MPLGPNYNYDLENQQLQQKLQIINAMQAGGLHPMEVPTAGAGQQQAKLSPLSALMPAISAYLGSRARASVKDQQTELGNRYKTDLVNGLEEFYNKSNGGWQHNTTPGAGEDSNADILEVAPRDSWNYQAPDQKAAIIAAMGSNHPVLQQMGQAGLASMYKTDPMSQLLGLGQGSGQQPPAEVLAGGNYTVNGQPGAAAPASGAATPVAAQGAAPGAGLPPDVGAQAPQQAPAQPAPAPAPAQPNPAMMSPAQRLAYYFPMVPAEQARALIAADPTGKTLAEENAHRGRMIVAGDNVYQPTGPGQVTLPQGVLGARTAIKQGDAGVADQHELVSGTDPATGAPITRTKAQAINLTGQATGSNDILGQLDPAKQVEFLRAAAAQGLKSFDIDTVGANGQRVKGTVNLSGGGNGGGFVSGQAPALATEQQAYGSALAKAREGIDTDAETALSVKARVQEMREMSQDFTSGNFAPLKEKMGGIAISLGMDPDAVNKRMGNISSMQQFNKEATQLAFDMVKQLGSREAAAVVNQAIKSNANLENQPLANKGMLDVIEGMANWKLAKQEAVQTWTDTHNGSMAGFQTYFNKTQPITKFVSEMKQSSPMPMGAPTGPAPVGKQPSGAQQPISLEDYLKKHGVN